MHTHTRAIAFTGKQCDLLRADNDVFAFCIYHRVINRVPRYSRSIDDVTWQRLGQKNLVRTTDEVTYVRSTARTRARRWLTRSGPYAFHVVRLVEIDYGSGCNLSRCNTHSSRTFFVRCVAYGIVKKQINSNRIYYL